MQDLVTFAISRAPKRLIGDVSSVIAPPGQLAPLGDQLAATVTAVSRRLSDARPANVAPGVAAPGGGVTAESQLRLLEQRLAHYNDRVSGAALNAMVDDVSAGYVAANVGQSWDRALEAVFADSCTAALDDLLQQPVPLDHLADVVRTLLVCSLAGLDHAYRGKQGPDDVWALLNLRVVPFPQSYEGKNYFPKARVELVRGLAVADLNVIRSEWRRYVPGEVANIRNVMAHETFSEKLERVTESETTSTSESSSLTQTQQDTSAMDQSELSRDIESQMQIAIQGQVQTQYEMGLPGNRFSVSAGSSAGVQIGRSERTAARVAKEVVSKAVSLVESRTRQSRTVRELARTTESTEHAFEPSETHNRGIYRWVDRIDRYQVFTYPNRLQLEFQIPEPATYVRNRHQSEHSAAADGAPPAWSVTRADIKVENLIELASKYRATNLPALPDAQLTIVVSKSGKTDDKEALAEPLPPIVKSVWTPPTVALDLEPAVPSGYVARKVHVAMAGIPFIRKWHTENPNGNAGFADPEAYHTITATVLVAGQSKLVNVLDNPRAAQADTTTWSDAFLCHPDPGQTTSFALTPGAAGKLTLSAHAAGCLTFGATFSVECERTAEAYETWVNQTYDALFTAWSAWNKAWQNEQAQRRLLGDLPLGESSRDKNQQTIRDELKRQVISWLLQSSPFQGKDCLLPVPNSWSDIDLSKALDTAPLIQFLESAFEWQNMVYAFYPYYWADRKRWDELSGIEVTDPAFERFLRAGSARVVVPARPGMETAVRHWLIFQEPFLGRPLPVPSDPEFVSVAAEVNDMTRPPADGYPGECWEVRSGTTLVWLDGSADLPTNAGLLGLPPFEPVGQV